MEGLPGSVAGNWAGRQGIGQRGRVTGNDAQRTAGAAPECGVSRWAREAQVRLAGGHSLLQGMGNRGRKGIRQSPTKTTRPKHKVMQLCVNPHLFRRPHINIPVSEGGLLGLEKDSIRNCSDRARRDGYRLKEGKIR